VRWPLLLLGVVALSCVERRLHIRTEPEGAMVQVNGREVGRSPATWTFSHYGEVRVTAYLDGHLPEQRIVRLKASGFDELAQVDFDLVIERDGTVRIHRCNG